MSAERARRRRRQREPYPRAGASTSEVAGAVYVDGRDLGPGVFAVGTIEEPAGVVLSFATEGGRRHEVVELAFTAESAMAIAVAVGEFGAYQLQAHRREKAPMN